LAKKKEVPKAKVGNVEYPAHPFTVRVSNLSPEVEDMDLVDAFRPRCGAIVHAKIMREKSHHHQGKSKSKGWGVIQFELQESVDKALALSDIIGIREKLVNVERSHMPAVTLVPPGMHRVKPNGEGRNSKLNQKKKQQKGEHADEAVHTATTGSEIPAEVHREPSSTIIPLGVLAFRPRGVQQNRKPPKMRVTLGDDGKNQSK
jgi:RNA recognition motif-containing protein